MHPTLEDAIFPNESEKKVFIEFQHQLNSHTHVFYSLRWVNTEKKGLDRMGEADFVILDPNYGFLTVEVKGGIRIKNDHEKWSIQETAVPVKWRKLTHSPYEQARKSQFALRDYYQSVANRAVNFTFGSIVVFPFYDVTEEISAEFTENNTIVRSQMNDLQRRINAAFISFSQSKGKITKDDFDKIKDVLDICASSEPPIGACFENSYQELLAEGETQEAFIAMLRHYKQAIFAGAAGTGKTYMAMIKARDLASQGLRTLYVCYNNLNASRVAEQFKENGITADAMTFHFLMTKTVKQHVIPEGEELLQLLEQKATEKYDAILVDEAQDLNQYWAVALKKYFLKDDNSYLYVFFDEDQDIFNRNLGTAFNIPYPPFVLQRNLRNTSAIWNWTSQGTGLGLQAVSNNVDGLQPRVFKANKKLLAMNELEKWLQELNNNNISANDITILTDTPFQYSLIKGRNNIAGYPFQFISLEEGKEDGCITVCTIQSYKGLEAPVVICLLKEGQYNKKLEYVGFSRAKCLLYVMYYT